MSVVFIGFWTTKKSRINGQWNCWSSNGSKRFSVAWRWTCLGLIGFHKVLSNAKIKDQWNCWYYNGSKRFFWIMKMKTFRFSWCSYGFEQRRNQGPMVNGIVDIICGSTGCFVSWRWTCLDFIGFHVVLNNAEIKDQWLLICYWF